MDEKQTVKISLSGKITYNDDITLAQAGQIIAFIDSTSGESSGGSHLTTELPAKASGYDLVHSSNKPISPRSVLESSGAKTNPEKIVAFASLVLNEGGKDTFTIDDVKPMFRRARESTPANLSRDFDTAIKNGWVDAAEVKGEYYLTQESHDAIEKGFEHAKKKPLKTASSGRRSSKAKVRKQAEVPEVFKNVDPIPSSLSGIPTPYAGLKVVLDRFLWVLALAKNLEADGLTNKDIVWATDHLGAGIPNNNINRNYTAAQKKGYVNKSTQTRKIRITNDGIKYLESLVIK